MNINTIKNKDYKDCFTFQNFKVKIQNIEFRSLEFRSIINCLSKI